MKRGTHITLHASTTARPANIYVQWNPSNPDTIGPEECVLIREVSLFQELKVHKHGTRGRRKCPV